MRQRCRYVQVISRSHVNSNNRLSVDDLKYILIRTKYWNQRFVTLRGGDRKGETVSRELVI